MSLNANLSSSIIPVYFYLISDLEIQLLNEMEICVLHMTNSVEKNLQASKDLVFMFAKYCLQAVGLSFVIVKVYFFKCTIWMFQ